MRKKIIERMPENVAFACKLITGFIILSMIVGGFMMLLGSSSSFADLLPIGLIVCGAALLLLFDYIIAVYFYGAALAKGYDDLVFLLLPFFFGIIGCLFVIAMPNNFDKKLSFQTEETKMEENSDVKFFKETDTLELKDSEQKIQEAQLNDARKSDDGVAQGIVIAIVGIIVLVLVNVLS